MVFRTFAVLGSLLVACSGDDAPGAPVGDAGTSSSSGGGTVQRSSFPQKYHGVGVVHVDAPGQAYEARMEVDFAQNSVDSDTLATYAGTGGMAAYTTPITYGGTGRASTATPDHGTLDPSLGGTLTFDGALGSDGATVSLAAAISWTAVHTYTGPAPSDNKTETGPSLIGSVCNASKYTVASDVITIDCPRNDDTANYTDVWTLTPL